MNKLSVSLLAFAAMFLTPLAHAGIVGFVGIEWLYPNSSTVFATDTIDVGSSLTCPGSSPICGGFGGNGNESFTVTSTSITYTGANYDSLFDTGAAFDGFEFTGVTFADSGSLSGVTISGDTIGIDSSEVSFTGNSVEVNLATFPIDGSFTLNLSENGTTSSVPEPGSLGLVGTALLSFGYLLRRRRVKA
jgi:hypothetical protein